MVLGNDKLIYLDKLTSRAAEIEKLLSYEEVLVDSKLMGALQKELAEISPLVKKYKMLKQLESHKLDRNEEYESLTSSILDDLTNKDKSSQAVIVLFQQKSRLADDLKNAYKKVCEIENLICIENSQGLKISGENALKLFENESGLHKSLDGDVTIVVFQEPESYEQFKEEDIRFDIFHSSGAGGQNINKVATAVRATHTKTNISTVCQDERTQSQNKQKAVENLRQKYEKEMQNRHKQEIDKLKKIHKSDRIVRSYNYKTNTIKDAKSNISISLSDFFNKELVNILKSNTTRS